MSKVRVLVAEDSPTMRFLLVEILRADPEMDVIGQARDGREAVRLAEALRPDVITMDIQMPVLDGFAATQLIMSTCPTPIVIVTSHADAGQVYFSMKALKAGALTIAPRPSDPEHEGFDALACQLVRTVKAMAGVKVVRHWAAAPVRPAVQPLPAGMPAPQVVAVATSAGGPPALQTLLAGLVGIKVPILIVQHIASGFVTGLAGWLGPATGMRVVVATEGAHPEPGTAYLAPDGAHLKLTAALTLRLDGGPEIGGFRPAGDALLASVGVACGRRALGVILTGMGRDGVEGARQLRAAGGRVLVQEPGTAAVSGMPEAAVHAGVSDGTMPLEGILTHIKALCAH